MELFSMFLHFIQVMLTAYALYLARDAVKLSKASNETNQKYLYYKMQRENSLKHINRLRKITDGYRVSIKKIEDKWKKFKKKIEAEIQENQIDIQTGSLPPGHPLVKKLIIKQEELKARELEVMSKTMLDIRIAHNRAIAGIGDITDDDSEFKEDFKELEDLTPKIENFENLKKEFEKLQEEKNEEKRSRLLSQQADRYKECIIEFFKCVNPAERDTPIFNIPRKMSTHLRNVLQIKPE